MSNTASSAPRALVFAGPNGAGKSTHADAILAALGIETFVNADYIARGLPEHSSAVPGIKPKRPVKAGKAENSGSAAN